MLKFSEIFEFSKEKFRKIPILKEFEWFEWFEWFGPSPIEPFNSASHMTSAMVQRVTTAGYHFSAKKTITSCGIKVRRKILSANPKAPPRNPPPAKAMKTTIPT